MVGISIILEQSMGVLPMSELPDIRRPKLGPKVNRCMFLTFSKDSNDCIFLNLGTNSIIEARDAEFFENKFIKDKGLSLFGHIYCIIVTVFLHLFCNNPYNSLVLMSKFIQE